MASLYFPTNPYNLPGIGCAHVRAIARSAVQCDILLWTCRTEGMYPHGDTFPTGVTPTPPKGWVGVTPPLMATPN